MFMRCFSRDWHTFSAIHTEAAVAFLSGSGFSTETNLSVPDTLVSSIEMWSLLAYSNLQAEAVHSHGKTLNDKALHPLNTIWIG